MANTNIQDWKPVVFTKYQGKQVEKKSVTSVAPKPKNALQSSNPSVNIKKIENDEDYEIKYVSKEVARKIIAGRVAKKWTREQLAGAMSLPIATIKNIELCEEIENKQLLQRIARKLGIILND